MSAWLSTSIRVAVIVAGVTDSAGWASAQCEPQWLKGPGDPGWGIGGTVFSMTQFQDHLYIGGNGLAGR